MQTPIVTETSRLSAHRRQVELVEASLLLNPAAQRQERMPRRFGRAV
jgi:hypothetical protein